MTIRLITVPLAAAGLALGLFAGPAHADLDPCRSAVSSSRCLGPQGVAGFDPSGPNAGRQNGPYGPWGSIPPLG